MYNMLENEVGRVGGGEGGGGGVGLPSVAG
jgi:hypothetical protein